MSKDKNPSVFLPQMEAIMFIIIFKNSFRNMRGFENWGMSLEYSPVWVG